MPFAARRDVLKAAHSHDFYEDLRTMLLGHGYILDRIVHLKKRDRIHYHSEDHKFHYALTLRGRVTDFSIDVLRDRIVG